MKIQRHKTHKLNGKDYYKHVIVIPDRILEKAGLKAGDELQAQAEKGEIRLRGK